MECVQPPPKHAGGNCHLGLAFYATDFVLALKSLATVWWLHPHLGLGRPYYPPHKVMGYVNSSCCLVVEKERPRLVERRTDAICTQLNTHILWLT
ncbi:hypothetical protein GDO78_017316 [Eleutherodactylus coqui]|uniref:Uncharacterized protein n=1 Tax=Eleutherodactylus coqui TaxID=57060 RepID=A0A8J6EA27_ELECQ|nr:hypothetical protein GDO78_017316 [Eleutherodactylus coqui]